MFVEEDPLNSKKKQYPTNRNKNSKKQNEVKEDCNNL